MTGYRSGFVAADRDLIAALKQFRPSVGTAPQEFVQRASVPERACVNAKVFAIARNGNRVGRVGLQLDGICSGNFRRVNEFHRPIKALIVISGKLGDDVDGKSRSNHTAIDFDGAAHTSHRFCKVKWSASCPPTLAGAPDENPALVNSRREASLLGFT